LKKFIIIFILLFNAFHIKAQNNSATDSIISLIQFAENDSVKAELYFELGNSYSIENSLSSKINAYKLAESLFNKIPYTQHKPINLSRLGFCYFKLNDYRKSEKMYKQGIKHTQQQNDLELEFEISESYANTYIDLKPNSELINVFFSLKEKASKQNDLKLVFNALAQINRFHQVSGTNLNKIKENSDSMLVLAKNINDSNLFRVAYFNLAIATDDQESINNYKKCLQYVDSSSYNFLSSIYNNISGNYMELLFPKKSILYADSAIVFSEKSKRDEGIAAGYYRKGRAYLFLNENEKAILYGEKALNKFQQANILRRQDLCANLIGESYKAKSNYKEALKYFELEKQLKDSLVDLAKHRETEFAEQKFHFQLAQKRDSTEIALKMTKIKNMNTSLENEKMKKYLLYGGGGMLLLIAFILLIGFQRKKKDNLLIEQQKRIVEEKNEEITDSIRYAKRIQNAILPSNKIVKEYLNDSFILYLPKDIVAGDFYWMESVSSSRHSALLPAGRHGDAESPNKSEIAGQASNDVVLFAAADCTGHGVPGAMVSVICNNGLNRSVREHGITDPGKILDKTREIVLKEFEKSEDDVKDGMDIALCSLSVNSNQSTVLQYAGAHNPLWVIRKDAKEIEEIKANKQPIGKCDNPEPYTTHTIELQKGDSIYIFSDGYADQFGGKKGKKLKSANFKKLLLSIQNETMEKQHQLIDEAFENWKGELEQLDDVCVIGVRI